MIIKLSTTLYRQGRKKYEVRITAYDKDWQDMLDCLAEKQERGEGGIEFLGPLGIRLHRVE